MIHPSAYIDPSAEIGRNVRIGPFCYVSAGAVLGDDCILHNNVTIGPRTRCGRANEFYPNAVIGMPPQDLKYKGGDTYVEIGDDNVFREFVTVHAGTEVAGHVTRIGSHNRFLVGVHIAHDCTIGSDCILSNQIQLAGHVVLEDRVTMGGASAVHHFTTIGTLSFVGGCSRIIHDVPPYMIVEGNPGQVRGFNVTGMKRWGMTEEQIRSIRDAYKELFSHVAERRGKPMLGRLADLEARADLGEEVRRLCASIRRSLDDGVYGRALEKHRRDSDEDRRAFYEGRPSASQS
jgi:UDP-N-acetylglucosamine acyltransferase